MPWSLPGTLRMALVLLAWMCLAPIAPAQAAPSVVVLSDGGATIDAQALADVWVDPRGTALLSEVVQGPARFTPARPDTIYPLGRGTALWLHLRLMRQPADHQQWLIAFANPVLDFVSVHQQDAKGVWRAQYAGDTVSATHWPEAGRYPTFRLDLPAGEARDIYVQVRNVTATSLPVRIASSTAHAHLIQLEYLGLGIALGALLLLIGACMVQMGAYRDAVYGWYAGYAAINMLLVLAYTGIGANLLWPDSGFWADASQGALGCIAAGAAMLFVRNLTGIAARHRILDRLVLVGGWAGVAAAAAYLAAPRPLGLAVMSAYVLLASALNIRVAWLSWRRQDAVGLWVLLAYLPLTVGVVITMLRIYGVLPHSFLTDYALVFGMAMEVPLLLVALSIRSRERHGARIREQALSNQDALTGLLAPHLFQDRLRQVVSRYKRDKEAAAVVFIDLVNHPRIKAHFGTAVAEQSLLRSVIKLRKLVREIDTVGRIGEARFGLIMEGVDTRVPVTDRAARLIAAGLMPLPGLKPDVTLQFHIAGVLLSERLVEAAELPAALGEVLAGMSPRTRRPIRFLEPEVTQPAPLSGWTIGADSELPESAAAVNG
jgi:diguanylate cyclase (GGDEF)-like protein